MPSARRFSARRIGDTPYSGPRAAHLATARNSMPIGRASWHGANPAHLQPPIGTGSPGLFALSKMSAGSEAMTAWS